MEFRIKIAGENYEKIMRRAYPNQKSNRNGVNKEIMHTFMYTENGDKYFGRPNRIKQLLKIQDYLSFAVTNLERLSWTRNELTVLLDIGDAIPGANSSSQLSVLITQLLLLTEPKFRPSLVETEIKNSPAGNSTFA